MLEGLPSFYTGTWLRESYAVILILGLKIGEKDGILSLCQALLLCQI